MHNVLPGAKAYTAALQIALQRIGGRLICDANVQELLLDNRRVVGIRAMLGGEHREFGATHGVILAAGDYASNEQLIGRYKGDDFRKIDGINPFACGDGHRLAETAYAKLVNMDVTYGSELRLIPNSKNPFQQWLSVRGPLIKLQGAIARRIPRWIMRAAVKRMLVTWQHPEAALFTDGAILLNRQGARFVNETKWPDREISVAAQPEKAAWILLDRHLVERYSKWPHFISTAPDIAYAYVDDYRRLRPDVTHAGDSLQAAAQSAGIPANAAVKTVEKYNLYVAGRAADEFGRKGDTNLLEPGPSVLLGPVKAYFTTTEGGAAVNQRLQVLCDRGEVIPGLYAIGHNGLGGMILWGHGLHIARAMTSGRLAGRFVIEDGGKV